MVESNVHSLDGMRPSVHGRWPKLEGSGNAWPARPGGARGKAGAAHSGPRDACLICADPWDTGLLSLRLWARRGPSQRGSSGARTLTEKRSGFGEAPSL